MINALEQEKLLENFLLSEDLEELNNLTNQFNVFNALKLQNNEIRHSNFLGWLMTPYENHGLGDYFLKEFLKSAIRDYSLDSNIELSLKDIAFFNLNDSEIRREYKNIDILIISPQNNFLCVIENKIWSGEHDCQLERYAKIVNQEFSGYKKLYIYLTPETDVNCKLIARQTNNLDNVYYIPMNYGQVRNVIRKVLEFKSRNLSGEVMIFIEHYKEMIERNIMGKTDKAVVELCRKIYRENKEAIDLITSYNDITSEIIENIQEIYTDDLRSLEKDGMFAIKSFSNKENLQCGDSKYGTDLILLQLEKGRNNYCFCINIVPAKNGIETNRKEIIRKIEDKLGIKINNSEKENDWCWHNVSAITEDEYYNSETTEKLKERLKQKIDEIGFIPKLQEILGE